MDWIKRAKEQAATYETQRLQANEEALSRETERREAEASWRQRVIDRAREVGREGIRLRIAEKKSGTLEISQAGRVQIDFIGPGKFALKFFDVVAPTNLLLRQTLFVHHHRLVIIADLSPHNIEEIMKYAALGQDEYHRSSNQERLERNLESMLEATKIEERIAG